MKKVIAILAITALVACGGSTTAPAADTTKATVDTTTNAPVADTIKATVDTTTKTSSKPKAILVD